MVDYTNMGGYGNKSNNQQFMDSMGMGLRAQNTQLNPVGDWMTMGNYGGGAPVQGINGAAPTTDTFMSGVTPNDPSGGGDSGLWSSMFGGTDADGNQFGGAAMPAIQLGQGLLSGYLGMKQYGLAKDQFKQSKKQFRKNFNNQAKMTNTRLKDRQRARVAEGTGDYQSVDSYMKDNGVEGVK